MQAQRVAGSAADRVFPLAPMSPFIRILTLFMLALPVAFIGAAARMPAPLLAPGLVLIALYAWVWLRFRPTCFVICADRIEVRWPLKNRHIARAGITSASVVDNRQLRAITGAGLRVGVGGLWGGFGWLWTQRRGIAQMYVSRIDRYVWIERGDERPWLITPDDPEAFVRALR
jgi:hypothetical protein